MNIVHKDWLSVVAGVAAFGLLVAPASAASGGWSSPTPVHNAGRLSSVSCPSPSFCAAVDLDGNYTTYNNGTWSSATTADTTGQPNAVSCTSSSFCVLGDNGGYALMWNGSTWAMAPPESQGNPIDSGGVFVSVSCAVPAFCIAGDAYGYVFNWNGSAWNEWTGSAWGTPGSGAQPLDTNVSPNRTHPPVNGVSCPPTPPNSTPFCAAVDDMGNAYTFNGSTWSAPDMIDSAELISVSCPSSSFCAAVDKLGYAFTWKGGIWSAPDPIDTPAGQDGGFTSVSCASAGFCVAVDIDGNYVVYTGQWGQVQSVDSGTTLPLTSVSCPSPSFCAAVDSNGNALVYQGAPANISQPTITGSADMGSTLTAVHGTWSGNPISYAYQWLRCNQTGNGGCSPISGATSQTYTPVVADIGHALRVYVSATNPNGTGGPVASTATRAVTALAPAHNQRDRRERVPSLPRREAALRGHDQPDGPWLCIRHGERSEGRDRRQQARDDCCRPERGCPDRAQRNR